MSTYVINSTDFKSKNILTVMEVEEGGNYNQWARWFPTHCQSAGLVLVQACPLVTESDRGSQCSVIQAGPSQLHSTLKTWPKGIPSGAQNAVQSSLFPGGYPGLHTAPLTNQNDCSISVGGSPIPSPPQYLYSQCSSIFKCHRPK